MGYFKNATIEATDIIEKALYNDFNYKSNIETMALYEEDNLVDFVYCCVSNKTIEKVCNLFNDRVEEFDDIVYMLLECTDLEEAILHYYDVLSRYAEIWA